MSANIGIGTVPCQSARLCRLTPCACSILLYAHLVEPSSAWLLQRYVAPAMGAAAAAAWLRFLGVLLHAVWLAPVYVISLVVSCIWCVRLRHRRLLVPLACRGLAGALQPCRMPALLLHGPSDPLPGLQQLAPRLVNAC